MTKFLNAAASVLITALSTACATSPDDTASEVQVATSANALASLELPGTQIRWLELAPGSILTLSQTDRGLANPLQADSLKGKNLLEVYEQLAQHPAPEPLRAAYERSIAVLDDSDLTEEEEPSAPSVEVGAARQALSGAEFQSGYCGNKQICSPDMTEDHEWGEYRSSWANGYLDVVEGKVDLQVRARRVRGWENYQYTEYQKADKPVAWSWTQPARGIVDRQFRLKVAVYQVGPVVNDDGSPALDDAGNQKHDKYNFSMDMN